MSTQKVTGLASGFDTTSIVEQLMSLERVPYEKLDVKKQTEQLKLQAYQAVNTYLMKFRNSISSLSSSKLWNSKATVSTNEKSLTASANEYAVKGSYSFKVAQLATATQYMSKGFSSSKTPIVSQKEGEKPYKVGSVNLASAKTRVDNSAKLDVLNGGSGVYRGSIRVTDRKGNTSTIDLSACDTMDDVVRTINESSGALISASIEKGRLQVKDESGGTGILKIQNVGTGTTATNLGIAGVGGMGTDTNDDNIIHGRNVYTLGNDMSLKLVNDGLGVEEGNFGLRIYGPDSYVEMSVNVDNCKTVGDVIKRVNDEIERLRTEGFGNDEPNPGGGDPAELLKNLRFGVSGDGNSFSFTGVQEGNSYHFFDYDDGTVFKSTPAAQLGLTKGIQTVATGQKEVMFDRVLGDVDSPLIRSLGGVTGNGVGIDAAEDRVPVEFNGSTKIKDLNKGNGIDISMPMQFIVLEGGKDANGVEISDSGSMKMFTDVVDIDDLQALIDADGTLEDLVNLINSSIADFAADNDNGAAGLRGLKFKIDVDNNRIVADGIQGGYSIQIAGSLAQSLGVTFARKSDGSSGSALELDSANNPAMREAIDEFYGMGDGNQSLSDEFDNDPITMQSTMDKLVNMLSDPSNVTQSLTDLFSGKSFQITVGEAYDSGTQQYLNFQRDGSGNILYESDGVTPKFTVATPTTFNWDTILSSVTLDDNTTMGDIVNAMNAAIKDEFVTNQGYEGPVPEVRINSLGNGLQWSNMDFTKFWSFEDASGSDALDAMGLAKDTVEVTPLLQPPAASAHDLDPRATGYYNEIRVDSSNSDSITLNQLNFGQGITFGGKDDDTIDIEFKSGQKISITKAELAQALADKVADLQSGGSTITGAGELTVDEYVDVLNSLLDEKIDDHYPSSTPAGDRFDMKFKVSENGGLIIDGLKNADSLIISGNLVDNYGFRTGITPVNISDVSKLGATHEIKVNNLVAADFYRQDVEGLGEIHFYLGGDDSGDPFILSTKGLDQNSSFKDLINQLNAQLDKLAVDNSDDTFTKIRFTLNDSGTGIAVENNSNTRLTFVDTKQDVNGDGSLWLSDAQHLAQDLGLVGADNSSVDVEAYSFHNARSVGRNYVSRATSLDDFLGANADKGTIQVTNALGKTQNIGLENCRTLGDVIDAINAEPGFGVYAQINARGDGIDIIEVYEDGKIPDPSLITHNVSIQDMNGGSVAKKLGIAGTGTRDKPEYMGNSVFEGSLTTSIDVMSTDTLESIMYRISETGNYKTAIVNDGSSTNPYRLTISSTTTGEANDFVIDTDIAAFGFNQTSRGRDAKVLYGDPNAASSPVLLSSSTNSNNSAILGLTLDLKSTSTEWTTITVDDDKEKVKEEITAMVESYNEFAGIITYLDAYDEETGEPGILFGDSSVRKLMDDINEFFYAVFNPNNKVVGSVDADGRQNTWTWMDLGVNLSAKNSNADGSGNWYTTMDLDLDKLDNMVANNWDVLSTMLANQRNASNINNDDNVRPTGSFNGELAAGFDADGAINGDINKSSFGTSNGIEAAGTIKDGNDSYTIWFQKPTTMTRLSLYHQSNDTALKDFTIEYLDASTGKWEVMREITNNQTDANHLGMALPATVSAVRITAGSTNAADDKFRLLDVQVFEENGLAGKLNQLTSVLGDTQEGFLAERNTEVQSNLSDIDEQMNRLLERLTAKEESLWRRFTAMEKAMGQLQNQSNYFSGMMNSMSSNKK